MKQIAVAACRADAEDVLERLLIVGFGRQGFNLPPSQPLSAQNRTRNLRYHLDGRIRKIDELGKHLPILSGGVQLGGVPKGQDCAHQLSEAFGPCSVGVRLPS